MSTQTLDLTRRSIRQHDLVPPDRLAGCNAIVIGVGAVGRQVALQLAAMGIRCMALYDHDRVNVENLAPQGFWESDLGSHKVTAVANLARKQFPRIELHTFAERFRKSHVQKWSQQRPIVVFCCVDGIEARKLIWESIKHKAALFIDGRISAEVIRVLASDAPSVDRRYQTTLFSASEAYAGECTSKSTIYIGSLSAALMVAQFTRWLRKMPVISEQLHNILAQELTVT